MAAVLALVMAASLVPVTGAAGEKTGELTPGSEFYSDYPTGFYKGKFADGEYRIKVEMEEVYDPDNSIGPPYVAGKTIAFDVTFTNVGEQIKKEGGNIKISVYNTFSGSGSEIAEQFTDAKSELENEEKYPNDNNLSYKIEKVLEYSGAYNPTLSTDLNFSANDNGVLFDADGHIKIRVSHQLKQSEINAKKTLLNIIAIYVNGTNNGLATNIGSPHATVENDENKSSLTIQEVTNSGSDPEGGFHYTVQLLTADSDISGDKGDLTFENGKADFTLHNGGHVFTGDILSENSTFKITQTGPDGYTTTYTVSHSADVSTSLDNEGVAVTDTVGKNDNVVVTFTNTKNEEPPEPSELKYHLNLPSGFDGNSVNSDYYYRDTDPQHILEFTDIASGEGFENEDNAGDVKKQNDNDNNYKQLKNGILGSAQYFFVGWSKDKNFKLTDDKNYSDVDFPVIGMESSKDKQRRLIYAYDSNGTLLFDPYETDGINDLYAVWTESCSGLFGYTMQLAGATFPGVVLNPSQGMWVRENGRPSLGNNGLGGGGAWQKFTVLDGGHSGGQKGSPLSVEMPAPAVQVDGVTWDFVGWFDKGANTDNQNVSLTSPSNREDAKVKFEDESGNTKVLTSTVNYGGGSDVYSIDAVWSRVNAPTQQIVPFKAGGNAVNFDDLYVALTCSVTKSGADVWQTIFGSGSNTAGDDGNQKVTSDHLNYYLSVTGPEGPVSTGWDASYTINGLKNATLRLTKPGRYTISVTPKLENIDVSGQSGNGAGNVTINFGTVTFTFIIVPQLEVTVIKNFENDDEWQNVPEGGFQFHIDVAAENRASNSELPELYGRGDFAFTADRHEARSFLCAFAGEGDLVAAAGEYQITVTETVPTNAGDIEYADPNSIVIPVAFGGNTDDGYTLNYPSTAGGAGNVTSETTADGNLKLTVTFTNKYHPTGSLTITKRVEGEGAPASGNFSFTVTAADEATRDSVKGGAFCGHQFDENGVCEDVSVAVGGDRQGSVTLTGLPVGQYRVKETAAQKGVTEVNYANQSRTAKDEISASVTAGGNAEVTVTNTYRTGSLTVQKVVEAQGSGKGTGDFEITVTFDGEAGYTLPETLEKQGEVQAPIVNGNTAVLSLKDGQSYTFENIPYHTSYTVTEEQLSDALPPLFDPSDGKGVVQAEENTVTVTNRYAPPNDHLAVWKVVEPSDFEAAAPKNPNDRFTIRIEPLGDVRLEDNGTKYIDREFTPEGVDVKLSGNVITLTLGNDDYVIFQGLPVGQYRITELPVSDYKTERIIVQSGSGSQSEDLTNGGVVTLSSEDGKLVTVTNKHTPPTGDLTVRKTVTGGYAPEDGEFTFTVKALGGLFTKEAVFLAENVVGGQVAFRSDGTAAFTVKVSGKQTDAVIYGLPEGEYNVREELPDGSPYTSIGGGEVKVENGGGSIGITNEYRAGSLSIGKTVTGPGDKERTWTFHVHVDGVSGEYPAVGSLNEAGTAKGVKKPADTAVTFDDSGNAQVTLAHGQKLTINGLPAGREYTVTEEESEDYQTIPASTLTGTISAIKTAEAAFTNVKPAGNLIVAVQVTDEGDVNKEWFFRITLSDPGVNGTLSVDASKKPVTFINGVAEFTLKSMEFVDIRLPDGVQYKVEELNRGRDGYTTVDGKHEANFQDVGTVNFVWFVNDLKTGDLTISKTVTGYKAPTNGSFEFTVTAVGSTKDLAAGNTFGEQTFNAGGSTDVTVNMNGSLTGEVTLAGLPAGDYTVTEKDAPGYTLTTGNEVAVKLGKKQTVTVGFANEYNAPKGTLTVEVTVAGAKADEHQDEEFGFTITGDPSLNGEYGGLEFHDGVAHTTVTPGTPAAFPVPAGRYTVEQTGPNNADETSCEINGKPGGSGPADVAVEPGGNTTVTVKNLYAGNGSLTIVKTVAGENLTVGTHTFTFTVRFMDRDGSPPTGINPTGGAVDSYSDGTYTFHVTAENGSVPPKSVRFGNLPYGTRFEITEVREGHQDHPTAGANFGTQGESQFPFYAADGAAAGAIGDGEDLTVNVTNISPFGKVSIRNRVVGRPGDPDQTFTYTMTIQGDYAEEYTGAVGTSNFSNGVATFTLAPDTGIDVYLPVGVEYTVTQAVAPNQCGGDWTRLAVAVHEDGAAEGADVIPAENGARGHTAGAPAESAHTVTFTNYYLADLIIGKRVEGHTSTAEFHFDVTLTGGDLTAEGVNITYGSENTPYQYSGEEAGFTLRDGGTITFRGVPTGTVYTVRETASGAQSVTYSTDGGGASETAPAKAPLTGDTAVTVTNLYPASNAPGGDPGYTPPPTLNTEDHFAYVIGCGADRVMPEGNITRAEIATILFRLLTDETRDKYLTHEGVYPDVASDAWYANAVNTLTAMGIVTGSGGRFRPGDAITRAEMAAIVCRFFEHSAETEFQGRFQDVDEDVWYAGFVEMADRYGIMTGEGGDTFRPEASLTRAQAMAVMNRLLGRHPDRRGFLDGMIRWADNADESAWYYADIQEATNSHKCRTDTVDGRPVERWTELLPTRDWSELERGRSGGEPKE